VRGEITLVVGGAPPRAAEPTPAELAALVAERMAGGESRRDAVAAVAAITGAPRRAVYEASLA